MLPRKTLKKVIIIVGPTAVGKTEFSIRLAERINGEIISADSRLLYRGMEIGTAKPSVTEMSIVPHHMIDLSEPDDVWSLSSYQERVLEEINLVQSRSKVPIVVGGTGQYIRSLIEGWRIPPQPPDHKMRMLLETWANMIGKEQLYQKLAIIDPKAAAVIDMTNVRRTIRALEVIFLTGQRFSDLRDKNPSDFEFILIGLIRPRDELYRRVDQRIDFMFDRGLIQEVEELLNKGYDENLSSLSAIGYRETINVIHGECSIDNAKVIMKRKTRQFIRRQANWFKPDDPQILWFEMIPDPLEQIVSEINNRFTDTSTHA